MKAASQKCVIKMTLMQIFADLYSEMERREVQQGQSLYQASFLTVVTKEENATCFCNKETVWQCFIPNCKKSSYA